MKPKALNTARYSIELNVGSEIEHFPIVFRKRRGARHMVIRYQPLQHIVTVTLPPSVSIRQGLHFAHGKRQWLAAQVLEHARHVPFENGQIIPLLGRNYTLTHVGGRGVVTIDGDRIIVPGQESFMPRRVRDWIKYLAREEITELGRAHAEKIGQKIKRVSVRDTASRWGSCSHDGCLSFSWRLALAPYSVLDYVVCHEVAHVKEHNHSPDFWALVAELCPGHEAARDWLAKHGATLYGYG